jgi:hypothetical protein
MFFINFADSNRGAFSLRAEIIPSEPDPDNAGEGRVILFDPFGCPHLI